MLAYCLAKPGAWADNPWGHDHPVVKVGPAGAGKIFAFLGASGVGGKGGATRDVADERLHRLPEDAGGVASIRPSGWNHPALGGAVPDEEVPEAVDESYRLVTSRLPKKHRPEGWDAVSAPGG